MKRVVFSPEAVKDLDEIWAYIAEDSVDAAERMIRRIEENIDQLAQMPGMGHKREDLTSYPLLFWPVGSYLIIYWQDSRPLRIVAIVRGSRDIPVFIHKRLD